MVTFTVSNTIVPLCGGLIICLATSLNLWLKGRITGASSIFYGAITCEKDNFLWKSSFLAGLVMIPVIAWDIWGFDTDDHTGAFDRPEAFVSGLNLWAWIFAGFFVGFGTKLSNGCTSGHGVCGLPRWNKRSFVAVIIFFGTSVIVATMRYNLDFWENTLWPETARDAPVGLVGNIVFLGLGLGLLINSDIFISFGIGALFATGLIVGGVVRRSVVIGFLTLNGDWNPALMFVLMGAVGGNMITFHFILKQGTPSMAYKFDIPSNQEIDGRLVVGALLFGLGWGIGGLCPAPALIAAAFYLPHVLLLFVTTLIAGQLAAGMVIEDKPKDQGYEIING